MTAQPNYISVVVLTYNRSLDLMRCLNSLLKQTISDFEIIVIDNGSTDETPKLLEKYPVRVLRDTRRNKAYLRNLGLKLARGDIVAFIDDDAEAAPEWLKNIITPFQSYDQVGAVGGPTIVTGKQEMLDLYSTPRQSWLFGFAKKVYEVVVSENRLFEICAFLRSGAYSIGGSLPRSAKIKTQCNVDILSTCNAAVRRKLAFEIGAFDEAFFFNHEDGDFFLRIKKKGCNLVFNPKAIVWHHVNSNKKTRANAYLMGRDFGYFYTKHVHPRRITDVLRHLLNIVYFNSYWLYSAISMKNVGNLKGIIGFALAYRVRFRRSDNKVGGFSISPSA